MQIKLKGSEQLHFIPMGKTTEVSLTSAWSDPSFNGNFLPEPYQVNETGFTASWKILHLNRSYPQEWKDKSFDLGGSSFGVSLLQVGDTYSKTERSVKYAILFVTLTFLLYFFIEILQKKKVHPLQYVLVGLAIIIFYTLLLSISEYLGFNAGYFISATATVLLITAYTKSMFRDWKIVIVFFLVLSALYGFIFALIQLQDGALLFGSIGLFIILAIVMYYSRKIEWYTKTVATSEKAVKV
jgi:inner membrane protein